MSNDHSAHAVTDYRESSLPTYFESSQGLQNIGTPMMTYGNMTDDELAVPLSGTQHSARKGKALPWSLPPVETRGTRGIKRRLSAVYEENGDQTTGGAPSSSSRYRIGAGGARTSRRRDRKRSTYKKKRASQKRRTYRRHD